MAEARLTSYATNLAFDPDSVFDRTFTVLAYSTSWGYYQSGGVGLILLIVIILAWSGRI